MELLARPQLQPKTPIPFTQFSFHYFAHHLTDAISKFHDWLVPHLSEFHKTRNQRECYIAPRGAAKTTWTTLIYPIYCALYGLEQYLIVISDVQINANKFLKNIKEELIHNEKLQADFPELCGEGPVWREEAIELNNGVRIEALGKGGRIRGRKHKQYRPSLIVGDDLQNLDDIYSELQMDKDWEWLNADVLKAGSPTTNYLILGTALHANCIVCKIETTPGWKFKRFSSLITEPKNQDLWNEWRELLYRHDDPERDAKALSFYTERKTDMDAGESVLWEQRFPIYWLMQKRVSEGERAFQSEEQGYPMPPGEAEWPAEYFDHAQFWFDEWPDNCIIHTLFLDPSKGKTDKAGDFQAYVHIGRTADKTLWVEAWLEKFDAQGCADQLVEIYMQCLRKKQTIEKVGLEANSFQELLRIPIDISSKNAGVIMPLVLVMNTVAKPVRIRRWTTFLAQHRVRFKRGSKGTQLMVKQMKEFRVPQSPGSHDDGPDAGEGALRIMMEAFNEKYFKSKQREEMMPM